MKPNEKKRLSRRRTLLISSGGVLYTADKNFGGQDWERASFLVPLPFCFKWLHELARPLRCVWPLWFVFSVDGRYLSHVWGRGHKLIEREVQLTAYECMQEMRSFCKRT